MMLTAGCGGGSGTGATIEQEVTRSETTIAEETAAPAPANVPDYQITADMGFALVLKG
jgi:hypothetical protein